MTRVARLLIPTFCLLALWHGAAAQDRCFRIGAAAGAGATGELLDIGAHIFSTAHLCATMVRLPQNRVRSMIEAHELDGEITIEIAGNIRDEQDLVPTPIAEWQADLFWPDNIAEPLAAGSTIGVVLGQDWARVNVIRGGFSVFEVRDNRQLFEMVMNQRVQGIILPRISAEHFQSEFPMLQHMKSRKITDLAVVLHVFAAQREVITTLNQAIRTLKANGYITDVFKRYAGR